MGRLTGIFSPITLFLSLTTKHEKNVRYLINCYKNLVVAKEISENILWTIFDKSIWRCSFNHQNGCLTSICTNLINKQKQTEDRSITKN